MISAKTSKKGLTVIDIYGSNLENITELIALIDSVSRVVFKNNDSHRRSFIMDIPYLILESQPTISQMELPCSPEDLKKFGGDKEGPQL